MEEHPRMSFEKPVEVTLSVAEPLLDAVEDEFCLVFAPIYVDGRYQVKIHSTRTSIGNCWRKTDSNITNAL